MLPNFVNKDDLTRRLEKSAEFYRSYNIPISIIRKTPEWCQIVMWTDMDGKWYDGKIYSVRLTDEQLSSVRELLEEVCDRLQIPYKS